MTQPGAVLYTQGFGSRPENVEVPVIASVAPTSQATGYPVGKRWIDQVADLEYVLTSFTTIGSTLTANWTLLGTDTGALNTLSDDTDTVVTPDAGNIQIQGTSGQILSTGGVAELTLSLPTTMVVPGSLKTTTTLEVGTTLTVDGNTVLGSFSATGVVFINTTVGSTTQIGTGGLGVVDIGNTTGGTVITGPLTASGGAITLNSSSNTFTIESGTGALNIGSDASTTTISIGNAAAVKTVTLGSVNSTSTTNIQGGSGGIILGTNLASTPIQIGNAAQTGGITIGNSTASSTIQIAASTGAQTVSIGDGGTGVKTITIGTGAVADVITIGSSTTGNITHLASAITALPGPVYIYTGAGAPASGLALHVGDLYINTSAATALTRMYIATGASTWTNFTTAG